MHKQLNRLLLGMLFTGFAFAAFSQTTGKVIEAAVMKSEILGRDVKYSIYLPPDYATSERPYPIVYLFHGYTDDHTTWLQSGEVNRYADKAIAEGSIPSMIIAMPDADVSWFINSYDGKEKYEDFFIKEFMPNIEKMYRVKAKKRYRGIAGLSMGGFGSMLYALKYPNLFAAAAPLSAAIYTDTALTNLPDARYEQTFARLYGRGLKGQERLSKTWYENSIFKIVETKSAEELRRVRYWLDCGDDDGLVKANSLLHIRLMEKGVPNEFRVRNGAHTWSYWRNCITEALQFIGQSFNSGGF